MGMETKTIGIEDLKCYVLYVRDAISDCLWNGHMSCVPTIS